MYYIAYCLYIHTQLNPLVHRGFLPPPGRKLSPTYVHVYAFKRIYYVCIILCMYMYIVPEMYCVTNRRVSGVLLSHPQTPSRVLWVK